MSLKCAAIGGARGARPVGFAGPTGIDSCAMSGRAISIAAAVVALAAVLALGAHELDTHARARGATPAPLTIAQTRALLAGAPTRLAALHAQAGALLDGGATALRARLRALRGVPVVLDRWASWCGPCQAERAIFQRVAALEGRRVAFVGIDSGDRSRGEALAFMAHPPVSYPSYWDPSETLGEEATDSSTTPVTVFYTASGGRFIHQGPFESVAALEADVQRYALADAQSYALGDVQRQALGGGGGA
jgi:cytochrome c biogenesis protein CcmG/thiol:disulfide interchange protein DsbE